MENKRNIKKAVKRILTVLLALVTLFSQIVFLPVMTRAAESVGGPCLEFDCQGAVDLAKPYNTELYLDSERNAMTIATKAADPIAQIDYQSAGLSCDIFKYIAVIYEIDETVANTSDTQLFFATEAQPYETAEASCAFYPEKGRVACEIIDMTEASYWSGDVKSIRVDPFRQYGEGDTFHLFAIGLAKTQEEAAEYAEQFIKEDVSVFSGDTDLNGQINALDSMRLRLRVLGEYSEGNDYLYDLNDDNKVDTRDINSIIRIITGLMAIKTRRSFSLGEGNYDPKALVLDSSYHLSGTVSGDFPINRVTMLVTDITGDSVYYMDERSPLANSFELSEFSERFDFSTLGKGKYILKICAEDDFGTKKTLVYKDFSVYMVESTLAMGSGTYAPGTLAKGKAYSISGTITSNYAIDRVVVGVYNTDGTPTAQVASATPNAMSYDISNLDANIKFGSLDVGSYYFCVSASDVSGKVLTLVNNSFTVSGTSAEVLEFQENALSTWVKPVRAKILSVVGTGRGFGAYRTSTRQHAGMDYYVSGGSGTPVYAMQSGTVVEYIANFYYGTSSVAIQHADGSVARYCEISTSLRVGNKVTQGQQIATIIGNTLDGGTMLHLELYMGTASGSLTQQNNTYDYVTGSYKRRRDILNPEFLLNLTRES